MNSAGYSLIEKLIRAREKYYPLFKYILYIYIYIFFFTKKIKVYFVLKTNTIMMQKIDTMYFTSQII